MYVSEARLEANRRNAQRSTGPKTAEGKERSRANALKHGLCSSVVVAEDAQAIAERTEQFFKTLRPQNHYHCWIVTEIALCTLQIDRSERMQRRSRDKVALRAELTWDDDRRLDAMLLGRTLANRPDVVVEQLRKNVQGCEWLMSRWAMLKYTADVDKKWTAEQTSLAFDLLGTPHDFRVGKNPGDGLDFEGNLVEAGGDPAEVARRQIADLKQRREVVEPLDEVNRALTIADLGDETDPELKRVRRYEGMLHSRIRWLTRELRYQSPHEEPLRGLQRHWMGDPEITATAEFLPEPAPLPTPEPLPIPAIEPEPMVLGPCDQPPFDLEPDEFPAPGATADIPAILKSRRQKKLKKAEARRVSQRRKVEKLRA